MKLTTKRNRWYFWRELFSYMIPMILIVGSVDVFLGFMQCPIHPENSAPCSVNWILAAAYGIILLVVIILAIISTKMLRNVKKKIENEFFLSVKSREIFETINKKSSNKKDSAKKVKDKKSGIIKMIETNKHEEDDDFEKGAKVKSKRTSKKSEESKKKSTKKKVAKK